MTWAKRFDMTYLQKQMPDWKNQSGIFVFGDAMNRVSTKNITS